MGYEVDKGLVDETIDAVDNGDVHIKMPKVKHLAMLNTIFPPPDYASILAAGRVEQPNRVPLRHALSVETVLFGGCAGALAAQAHGA